MATVSIAARDAGTHLWQLSPYRSSSSVRRVVMLACRRTSATANKEGTGRHAASMLVADLLSTPSPHIVYAKGNRSAPHPVIKEGSQLADMCMCAGPRNQADTRDEVEREVQFRSLR